MAIGYPSGSNTYVPQFDASGQLVVSFSRNPKDFALNQYITVTPVKKSIGYYLKINAEMAAKVLNANGADRVWHDGNDAPEGNWGNEAFNFQPYSTIRYAYPFRLGYKAVEQADWKILASHAAIVAQAAMTFRSQRVLTSLSNTANFAANHTGTATALGGAKFNAGTVAAPSIKKTLLAAAQQIQIDTLGTVGPKDLVLIVNPVLASAMASSDEVQDTVKHSSIAMQWLQNKDETADGRWGLPPYLWGFRIIVDDTVMNTNAKGGTLNNGYALPNTTALLVARPGGLTGVEGSASFSTCHVMAYEEMTVESKDDPDNRLTRGRVVDDFDVQIVAPATGFVITACL